MKKEDREYVLNETISMFEHEFNLWFQEHYKAQLVKMTLAQTLELRKRVWPAFLCGLHIGLTGSIVEELLYPMLDRMQKDKKK